ncbi:hypothetical protein PUNSTDRAFT_138141 [Punctularia strigosozonata HHB-11173 SS5]|uniref:NmrA-like domain-containing protein n=1 Tax=Punctularia strigosozonata (strain HHB-11173) TaxID=741275 RepID=R7S4Y6_PUNST|nr:uncharacterized protein PUNSTDRAFT_138141 [Punctularia strigosozonata HHB-11173 SS5]EIN04954.1 hypothetical protein PUNSTDRAFT_138141 [Punctularia strigosozonata HHB-11173 SS5]
MSATYRSIAILGASGNVGQELLAALALHPRFSELELRVLTRNSTIALDGKLPWLNLSTYTIDYDSDDVDAQLANALRGVEVVVSVVGDDSGLGSKDVPHTGHLPGFQAQEKVARAAKTAGISLFVPAEYGYPTHTIDPDASHFLVGKRLFLDTLNELQIPYLLLYTGSFPKIEPPRSSLPDCTPETPKGSPPFETTRFHLAAYLARLILDRGAPGIYRILGVKRDRLATVDGKETWVLDEGEGLKVSGEA